VPTLKTAAQLVVVDVVVEDRNHQAVHGLTAKDFSVAENGAPQRMEHFEEHKALSVTDATKFPPMPKLPAGIFTNYTPAPANGALNILLFDSLNTPLADQSYMRQQMLDYLKTVPAGTRVAIFGLSTHLVLLQGFTSDTSVLREIVEKSQGKGSKSSFVLEDKVGGAGIQDSLTDDLEDQATDSNYSEPVPARVIADLRDFDAIHDSLQLVVRTKYTLDAMNEIARYVSGIPGRKNLIWFSGSFPLDVLPDETGQQLNAFMAMESSDQEYYETIAKLSRSQVAVYPIDVRGVTMSSVNDASSHYTGSLAAKRMRQDEAKFLDTNAAEHSTMDVLAADTGGQAFFNTNNLTAAVTKAVQEGSNFYTVSYIPTDQRQDGKERKIKVQLARPGLNLSYRTGYYADLPEKNGKGGAKQTDAASLAAAASEGQNEQRMVMMRGAPAPTEILIKVAVARMTPGNTTEEKVAAGNLAAPTTQGPYQRYSVNYAIAPGDLMQVTGEDGKIHIDYDALVYVYNENGDLVNWVGRTHPIVATADDVRRVATRGILTQAEVSVPAKGVYFLRIAVRDRNRDRYGAVEVATTQVKDVVAANAEPPAAGVPAGSVPATTAK
jgi:VWFA-related protein